MSNAKQATWKAKGGILAAIIAAVIALLTVGVGVAFGAEGTSDLVNKTIGDLVGGVVNAVKGGETPAETVNIPVKKVWDDEGAESVRPNSVVVNFGYSTFNWSTIRDEYTVVSTTTLDAAHGWEGEFSGVPADYAEDGHNYIVWEEEIRRDYDKSWTNEGFASWYPTIWTHTASVTGDAANGYVVTNRPWWPTFTIENLWVGDDEGGRPGSLTFDLLADGAKVDEITLTQEDLDPSGTYDNSGNPIEGTLWRKRDATQAPHPLYDENGDFIEYSIALHGASGYTVSPLSKSFDPKNLIWTLTAESVPPVVAPETSPVVVNRIDDSDGLDVTSMLLAESVPAETPVSILNLSALQMTITPGGTVVSPTADTETNALVYNFDLANGQTANVDLIVGSTVQVVNRTGSVSLAKKAGDGDADGQIFSVGTAEASSSLSLTVGASQSSTPSTPSQSGERDKGWIQVNKVINDGATYDAFKVFDADVVNDNGTYKGTHLTWADDAVLQAVRSFLTSYDEDGITGSDYDAWLVSKYDLGSNPVTYDMRDNPQNAAEFIAIKIADSDEDTTAATTPKTTKGDTFASRLATVLRNYGIEPTVVIPANTQTPADQGYYIVATTTATIENGEAGTAPIWAPVPATGYVVDEKVSVPTFNKQVKDNTDDATNFNKVADASTGQWLDFKLTTTLPQNLRAYPTYSLSISDQIPDGMDATIDTENGFSVILAGTDVTSKVDASLSGSTLSVSVANVLDEATLGVAVDGNDTLVVNYRARLNANSVKGAAGNNNTATLTYSADPLVASTTGTLESSARVLTYQLKVDKVDEATRLNVDGAKFVAKTNVGGTDYWVKEDGSLTTTEEERGVWTTENGFLTISGIDEGTYVLTEIEAPSLYETITTPLTVTIDAVKDYAGGSLTSLGAQASGANGTLVSNPTASQDGVVGTVLETGTSEVRISDVKQIVLPITGMPVKTAGIIAGAVIAIASVVAFIVDRRRKGDDEETEE